jgi:hypothetical protein
MSSRLHGPALLPLRNQSHHRPDIYFDAIVAPQTALSPVADRVHEFRIKCLMSVVGSALTRASGGLAGLNLPVSSVRCDRRLLSSQGIRAISSRFKPKDRHFEPVLTMPRRGRRVLRLASAWFSAAPDFIRL